MKSKGQRPAAPAGCKYRWVKGWGWGLFACRTAISMERKGEPSRGLWLGLTAPSWRIGPWAPDRWPTKQPIEPPPFTLRTYQAIVSAVITDALALSNDPCSLQRLRDLRVHILECRRESGSLFQDTPWGTPPHSFTFGQYPPRKHTAKQARGIRWAEIDGIDLYRRSDLLRWFIDAPTNDVTDNQRVAKRADPYTAAANLPHGVDSALAWEGGLEFHEVDEALKRAYIRALVGAIPSRKALSPRAYALAYKDREERVRALAETMTWTDVRKAFEAAAKTHRKPGRKPIGLIAQTTAERVRKHRRNKALLKRSLPTSVATAGTEQPMPLGPTVPVDLFTPAQGDDNT